MARVWIGIFSCLLQIFLIGLAAAEDDYAYTLQCPEKFTAGQVTTFKAYIAGESSAITDCALPPANLVFSIDGRTPICNVNYHAACDVSEESLKSQECGCTSEVDGVKTFAIKFAFSENDKGKSVVATICLPWNQNNTAPSNCDSIALDDGSGARGLHLTWMAGGSVTTLMMAVFFALLLNW